MSNKIDIYRCAAMAKQHGFDSATFDLVGPAGRLKCEWLDAYFGMFREVGDGEFMFVRDVPDECWCENFAAKATEA